MPCHAILTVSGSCARAHLKIPLLAKDSRGSAEFADSAARSPRLTQINKRGARSGRLCGVISSRKRAKKHFARCLRDVTVIKHAPEAFDETKRYETDAGAGACRGGRGIMCHDTSVYTRENRTARDYESLRAEVDRWQSNVSLNWSEDEINAVSTWLAKRYYGFSCPSDC